VKRHLFYLINFKNLYYFSLQALVIANIVQLHQHFNFNSLIIVIIKAIADITAVFAK